MKSGFKALLLSRLAEQRGAVIALVAIFMVVLVGLAAVAIDLSHLYVVRNELQNAADAGALAGARVLYNDTGTLVNVGANQDAYDAATANKAISKSGTIDVDVNWTSGNTGDVQRGHWSFGTGDVLAKGFYTNSSTTPPNLGERTAAQLDDDLNFINAVKVVARRGATNDDGTILGTAAASFFAKIFGYSDFKLSADAVGYIGFAGSLIPKDIDQPIAICKQAIYDDINDTYTCNTGRMINSSGSTTTNTGGWTNYDQETCPTANPSNIPHDTSTCENSNENVLRFGEGMGTTGGQVNPVFTAIQNCWMASAAPDDTDWRGFPKVPMAVTLPVINCPDNNVGNCSELLGAVTVEILWVKDSGVDPGWEQIPLEMEREDEEEPWTCSKWDGTEWKGEIKIDDVISETDRQACWQEFATTFNLNTWDDVNVGTLAAADIQKTFFFKPSCEIFEPRGITGGENYGILAKIPVLVE